MPRICIIGDSHLGALKQAWNQLAEETKDVRITFFGAPGSQINGLQPVDGRLVPDNAELRKLFMRIGRQPDIAPTYDVYVLYGMHLENKAALHVCRQEQRKNSVWTQKRRVQKAIRILRESVAIKTLGKVRQCVQAPVMLVGTPYKPNAKKSASEKGPSRYGMKIKRVFDKACNELAAEANATFLPQAEETIAPSRTTTLVHLRSTREGDTMHMNVDYGVIAMRQILQAAQDAMGKKPPRDSARSAPAQSAGEATA